MPNRRSTIWSRSSEYAIAWRTGNESSGGLALLNQSASRLPVSAVNFELAPANPCWIALTTSSSGCGYNA